MTRAECDQRYETSAKGKARQARYAASAKGKARQARYNKSPNGRARTLAQHHRRMDAFSYRATEQLRKRRDGALKRQAERASRPRSSFTDIIREEGLHG